MPPGAVWMPMTVRPLLLTTCLLALPCFMKTHAADWEKLPPLPEPNGGFMAFIQGDHILLAGGTNWEGGTKNWLRAVHAFDTKSLQWSQRADLDTPVAYGLPLPHGFLSGTDGKEVIKTHFEFGENAPRLTPMPNLPKEILLGAGGQVEPGLVVMAGGTPDAGDLNGMTRATFAIRTDSPDVAIETLPDRPGRPFGIAASATTGESLFTFGGAHWDTGKQVVFNSNEAYAFSMKTRSWKKLADFPYPVRGLTAVLLSDQVIYLAGGYKSDAEGFTAQAFLYDIKKDEYRPAKPLPYTAMVGLVNHDGHVYCLAGEDKQKSRTDACFRIPVAELIK